MSRTPSLACPKNRQMLPERDAVYWNILEYCRHIGMRKIASGVYWTARVRLKTGGYRQTRLAMVSDFHPEGICYDNAVALAERWFASPEISQISSSPYPKGVNKELKYQKRVDGFTIGDAMADFVEWKRIAGARSYFETTLSLVNHHIIPRLGDVRVEDFTSRMLTDFCKDVLETVPSSGKHRTVSKTKLELLDNEALRKRKKTLNTLIGILKVAFRMAWENNEVSSDRAWRCLKRLPHADTPRNYFLTRRQCKELIEASHPSIRALVLGSLYSGCRVSELAQMRVRDVGGHFFGLYVRPLKSYRPRYVHLTKEGMSFFLDQCEGKGEEDFVFTMKNGNRWIGGHKYLFKDAVRKAGLPEKFVFHGLRHTYASQLVQAGTPLAIVAKQLGHQTTDTVSRTYGHLSCRSIEEELEKRFAPIVKKRNDPRLKTIQRSLQSNVDDSIGWPVRNKSEASGEIVKFLLARR